MNLKTMKTILILAAVFASLPQMAALHAADAPQTSAKPNVVYLMADDLGWSDISEHRGGSIPTPNVEKLFSQGVELQNFMGWCVCSPTRAMLLTSRHPFRVGTGPNTGGELSQSESTIAEGFKANGYRTGIFGKWHNGDDPGTPEFLKAMKAALPNKDYKGGLGVNAHGFDEAWVYYGGGADYFTRRISGGKGPVSWWHNLEYRPNDKGYTEDFITQHAMDFIRENKDRPFFCYVPFHIVHAPLAAKPSDLALADVDADKNVKATDETKRTYKAMVEALDRNVAAILAELDQLGLSSNTIVVFTSDNGATPNGSNLPLRGGKHTLYEGGTHLFCTIRWPAGGLVGGGNWSGLCGSLDMYPTLMAMVGAKMPPTQPLDGQNIWPALRERGASPVDNYYWVWKGEDAIRTAQWRLHRYLDHAELYDIVNDISETHDVAAAHPETVKALTAKMNAWDESMGVALTFKPAPAKLNEPPAPVGDVLAVSVTATSQAKSKNYLLVPFASYPDQVYATDYIEYDVAVAPGSPAGGFFYTPFHGNDSKAIQLTFKHGDGVDQFGREQSLGPEPKGGPGVWEHRIIGLCSAAPGALPRHGLVFLAGHPGNYTVYLDNLRIRHADGTTTPIWTDRKDTRLAKVNETAGFKNIQVRTVSAAATH
jgi:arylsulfatase A-like enzyme